MKKHMLFLDNKLIAADDRLTKRLTPGILKGHGVFETLRVYPNSQVFGFGEHLRRLKHGLKTLKMEFPLTVKQIKEVLERVLELNHLTSGRVRIMVWQENHRVHTLIAAFSYQPFSKRQYTKGFKATISQTKLDDSSLMKEVKSLHYVSFLKAYQQAQAKGYDEAVLLNSRGELVEASRSNIFFLKDGKLYTPSLSSGCLRGITRGTVIKIAGQMKIEVKQMTTTPQELLNADEAFLTNSLIELMPLTSVEGRSIGDGKVGSVTLKILREYRRLVAKFSVILPPLLRKQRGQNDRKVLALIYFNRYNTFQQFLEEDISHGRDFRNISQRRAQDASRNREADWKKFAGHQKNHCPVRKRRYDYSI